MRLNTSTPALLGLSALLQLGSALPFLHYREVPVKDLLRRATYSIVPVDGGPIQTQEPETTVIQTIVHTQPPKTKTILQTDSVTLPPVTEQILTTKTMEGPKETQLVVVTITPAPIIATATSYSVIDIVAPSTTTKVIISSTTSLPSSSIPSTSAVDTATPSAASTTSSTSATETTSLASSVTSTSIPESTQPSPTTTLPASLSSSSLESTTPISSSSTRTFDDGLWKTSYPPWNDTRTGGAWIRSPRVTSLPKPLPTPVFLRSLSGGDVTLPESRAHRSVIARFLATFEALF